MEPFVTQIINKLGDGMTPEDQLAKQPGRDKNDAPIAEPKAEEVEKPAKPKPLPRMVEIGKH